MKKIISAILSLTMILAIVASMGISVSAATGDVLYEANFKGDDKFSPFKFDCAKGDDAIEVVPSEDGKSVTATYKAESIGRSFWGGSFKDLSYGAGKQYTYSMKVKVLYTVSEAGAISSGNAGVYINMANNSDLSYLADNDGSENLFGYYGCPELRQTLSYGAGSKAVGYYVSRNEYITDQTFTADAEGFHDLTFIVDGENVKLFINGQYLDEADVFTDEFVKAAGNVGFVLYLYNLGASITVKDVVVKEGISLPANAYYPDYYKAEHTVLNNYATANNGDILYSADFANSSDPFSHRFMGDHVERYNVTTDPANPNYIKFENIYDGDAGTYYGGIVKGLRVTPETAYTVEWKVKSTAKNTGFCFAMPTGLGFDRSYNVYGNFASMKFCSEHGSAKIWNEIWGCDTSGYTPNMNDLAYDADGYATFRAEMDGYTCHIFYRSGEDTWEHYNYWDMTEVYEHDFDPIYYHDAGFDIVLGFYLHNKGLIAEYKDMVVYKGLLIEPPEETTEPEETTSDETTADETTADETTADESTADETTGATPDVTTKPADDEGCGSVIAGSAIIIALLGTAIVLKKRD